MEEKVKALIEEIRPALQRDGGDVQFVELTADNVVMVELQGHCAGCPYSQMTVKMGIEEFIREQLPEIKGVEATNQFSF